MSNEITVIPEQIDTKRHFFDAFDSMETEISANWIVRFCQERKQGWAPFTRAEIEHFYHAKGRSEDFWFNGLIRNDNRYLICEGDTYRVTPAFVDSCYSASPVS